MITTNELKALYIHRSKAVKFYDEVAEIREEVKTYPFRDEVNIVLDGQEIRIRKTLVNGQRNDRELPTGVYRRTIKVNKRSTIRYAAIYRPSREVSLFYGQFETPQEAEQAYKKGKVEFGHEGYLP